MAKKKTATKKNLIELVAKEKGIHPDDARQIIQALLDKILDSLAKGERLEFRDFGIFDVIQRKQKIGRNPKNAEQPIVIPACSVVKFTPERKMDRATKKPLVTQPTQN